MNLDIIITGGLGFIGSNLVKRLLTEGYGVVVIDNQSRPGSENNLEWLASFDKRLEYFQCDVENAQKINEIFPKFGKNLKAVYHLAGQVAVTTSVEDPKSDFQSNALGSFSVLEAVRNFAPDALLVYSSTNKVYGGMEDVEISLDENRYFYKNQPFGIDEKRGLDFHSPYGCSKGAADQYAIDYGRIYGLNTVVLRQSCIYGYRQFGIEDQGWVAWFTIAAFTGKPITIFGDGKQVRDVLFIDDLVDLYLKILKTGDMPSERAFNIGGGPDSTLSLLELLNILEDLLGRKIPVKYSDWRPGDQKVFVADNRLAQQKFDWTPRINPKEGVDKLLSWIKKNKDLF